MGDSIQMLKTDMQPSLRFALTTRFSALGRVGRKSQIDKWGHFVILKPACVLHCPAGCGAVRRHVGASAFAKHAHEVSAATSREISAAAGEGSWEQHAAGAETAQ